jgi:hypothetical protein
MPADQPDLRADVLALLQNLRGTAPLKELFWSMLNYDRENKAIGRGNWPKPAAELLADDPTLLASGGKDNDFKVLYARLAKDRLSLSDERIVTSRLLKNHPYGLFVFSDSTQTNWHFLNVKDAGRPNHGRRLFRRLTVGGTERLRTASEVIAKLDLAPPKERRQPGNRLCTSSRCTMLPLT